MRRFILVAVERSRLTTTIEVDGIDTEEQALQYAKDHVGDLAWDEEHLGVENYRVERDK